MVGAPRSRSFVTRDCISHRSAHISADSTGESGDASHKVSANHKRVSKHQMAPYGACISPKEDTGLCRDSVLVQQFYSFCHAVIYFYFHCVILVFNLVIYSRIGQLQRKLDMDITFIYLLLKWGMKLVERIAGHLAILNKRIFVLIIERVEGNDVPFVSCVSLVVCPLLRDTRAHLADCAPAPAGSWSTSIAASHALNDDTTTPTVQRLHSSPESLSILLCA